MKIVYIANSIIPSQTANSIHVMKMCQAFALNGHDVVLLLPKIEDENIKIRNVYDFYGAKNCFKIIKLPSSKIKEGFLIFSFVSIWKAIKEKPDLIYTRHLFSYFFGSFLKVPIAFEIHSSFSTRLEKIFFQLARKNKIKKFIVISKALKKYFISRYNFPEKLFFVAPDGADPVNSNIMPKNFIKGKNKISVGYIGHLYKGRGIDIISEIAKRCPWAIFHIIGGLPADVEYWKKKLVGIKNLIFYGHIPHKEVYEYMQALDVLIAPYQNKVCVYGGGEGTTRWMSPLKIFEYMANGKAILSSDLPVLREILYHGKNSLLASPNDIKQWILNLEKIRNNKVFREELGRAAKHDFESKYSWESRADNIIKSIIKKAQ